MKICKDGRIWGQNNKEAGNHLGILTGRKYNYVKKGNKSETSRQNLKRKWSPKWGKIFKSGKNHPNWKDGITPLIQLIRNCFKYRQWRSDVFTRDNFTCVLCGVRSGKGKPVYLEADHYPKKFSTIFHEYKIKTLQEALDCEEFWNINNGRTLCRKCHNKTKEERRRLCQKD